LAFSEASSCHALRQEIKKLLSEVREKENEKISENCYYYGFLNKRVRYAIESATTRYPIMLIKLAIVEAIKG
jgi:predicted ATPase